MIHKRVLIQVKKITRQQQWVWSLIFCVTV